MVWRRRVVGCSRISCDLSLREGPQVIEDDLGDLLGLCHCEFEGIDWDSYIWFRWVRRDWHQSSQENGEFTTIFEAHKLSAISLVRESFESLCPGRRSWDLCLDSRTIDADWIAICEFVCILETPHLSDSVCQGIFVCKVAIQYRRKVLVNHFQAVIVRLLVLPRV